MIDPVSLAPVIAPTTPAKPAVINHVVKAAVALVPAGFLLWGAVQSARGGSASGTASHGAMLGITAGFAVVGLVVALVASRNLVALVSRPEMVLSVEGIRLRCWRGVGLVGWLLPRYRMRTYAIAWADLVEVKTHSLRINGILTEEELRIQTRQGLVAFGWDVFSQSVKRIQAGILDYIDDHKRAPLREAARLADFQCLRWAQPLAVNCKAMPLGVALLLFAAAPFVFFGLQRLGLSDNWYGPGMLVCLLLGGLAARRWWREKGSRRIELRSDGLALGLSEGSLRVLPWKEIQLVRAHTTSTGRSAPGKTTALEVRLHSGKSVMIWAPNAKQFGQILGHLEPPLDALQLAQQRIARGEAIETAAVAAGLQPR